jgi:2-polyprenyl-6-methoxyphenol hydroxylase-like FAD-dependent oxidoreductase
MAKLGEHAVVLGASMGGLTAARVLADFYETVTVVERDVLPAEVANRRGVPQGRHGHALLGRGLAVLAEFFPGFTDDLIAAGVPALDYRDLSEVYMRMNGHLVTQSGGYKSLPAIYIPSRPVLEGLVRQRVQQIDNISVLDGFDVIALTPSADGRRVVGAEVQARDSDRSHLLSADLVVDATGRSARTPALLESLGYRRPPEDHVTVRLTYSSQLFRMTPGMLKEKIVLVGAEPGRTTGFVLMSYENDTWMLTTFGVAGAEPPRELADMIDFVGALGPSHVHEVLRTADPIGPVCQFRYAESRWRRYDRLRQFPDGLLVLGDAICSFNPTYGQGMTVAALQAQALGTCLRSGTTDLPRRFFRAAAKPIGVAWQFATGADLSLPEIEGHRPLAMRLVNRYVERLQAVAEYDVEVAEQFASVVGLMDPPARLMRPRMLLAAARLRRSPVIPQEQMAVSHS